MLSKRNLPLGLLLLIVCLVYANSFSNSFHFDDFHTITDNPAVRSLGNLHRIFTDTTAFSVLPANQTYRPIVTASLALDYALGHGYVLFWFHLSTLIWFLVLVSVLFFLFKQLFDRVQVSPDNFWIALLIAGWFGLHPVMAETVNYIIQRGDLYCTLGCTAALYLFAQWPRLRHFGLYLLPFALAMLSKPPAAVFPLLLLFYVFFFETGTAAPMRRWRMSFVAALPAVAITVCLLVLQSAMTPKAFLPSILSPAQYRLTQPFVWLRYLGALFLPLHLNVDTDLQPLASLNAAAMAGLCFVVGLLGLIAYTARHRRLYPIAFGLLWFVITQLPTSLYPLSEVENDHRMFFSFPGLMLAVVWGLYLGYERFRTPASGTFSQRRWMNPAAWIIAVLALCGFAYGAHRRNQVWFSEATLWADDAAKSPHNGRGLMIYGLTRMNVGDYPEALALFQRALLYTPNYATLEINLGIVNGLLAAQNRPVLLSVAEAHFQRAIALAVQDDTPHAYYGRWLLEQGRLTEATAQLETAVSLNPQRELQRDLLLSAYGQTGNITAMHRLAAETLVLIPGDAIAVAASGSRNPQKPASPAAGLINASLAAYRAGQFQTSIEDARQALVLDPHSAEAWNNVGAGYGALGQWDPGIAAEQQALKLAPDLVIAQNNLRWFNAQKSSSGSGHRDAKTLLSAADYINLSLLLNQQGRYDESLGAARKALEIDPTSAEAWNNIAANDEALHRWDDAIAAASKAVALRPDLQLAKNNLAWAQSQKAAAAKR
ncbi:MAG: tetratricopeptide repeat protein [Janthinobacterium lividum]